MTESKQRCGTCHFYINDICDYGKDDEDMPILPEDAGDQCPLWTPKNGLMVTVQDTKHGHAMGTLLPAGTLVRCEPASNLPDSSRIKWWAHPVLSDLNGWTLELILDAEGVGVGLYADDVEPLTKENLQ